MFQSFNSDKIYLTAAGIAFYMLLAVFPGIVVLISVWGLLAEPGDFATRLNFLRGVLPAEAMQIFREQANEVAGAENTTVGAALLIGLAIGFFSASRAVTAMMQALNVVYGRTEARSFVRFNATAFMMTIAIMAGAALALLAIAALPAALELVRLGAAAETIIGLARWPLLFLGGWAGVAAVYRFAPDRASPTWRWIAPAAGGAVMVWIIASVLFSLYVQNFGNYNKTYGSIAGVVVMMLWFWASAFIFLVGAETAAEMETERDALAEGTSGATETRGQD